MNFSPETRQSIIDSYKYKGKNYEILHGIEEFSELIKELLKDINRGKDNSNEILEELADVCYVIEMIKHVYNITDDMLTAEVHKKVIDKIMPRIERWKQGKFNN